MIDKLEKICLEILRKIKLGKLADLYEKNVEIMRYLIFGALATLVNLTIKYSLLFTVFDAKNAKQLQLTVIIAWIVACVFAYFTNRIAVFRSKSDNILKEFASFVSARIFTLLLEMLIMFVFITWLQMNTDLYVVIWTIFAQAVVIVTNYLFSKLLIFRKDVET